MHHSGLLPLTLEGPGQGFGVKNAKMGVRKNPAKHLQVDCKDAGQPAYITQTIYLRIYESSEFSQAASAIL